VILDTSVLIEAERGRVDLRRFPEEHETAAIVVAAITIAELLSGVARSPEGFQRQRRLAFAEEIIDAIPAIPFDVREARLHAELGVELSRRGTPIGLHDQLIAATALAHGHAVATRNQAEFSRVPGLQVIPL
jgi:predicted nucleic acid-binding protein